MNAPHLLICLALLLPAAGCAGKRVAEPPAHGAAHDGRHDTAHGTGHDPAHDSAHAAAAATPPPATRWQADAPLSRGMQRVRAATEALAHGEHGHLDPAQVQDIATELRLAVDDMFANCRLQPAPDAALHPLLARVLGASGALAGGAFDQGALDALRTVLADYPRLFEDPAWIESQSD